jgi:hypothetical protein
MLLQVVIDVPGIGDWRLLTDNEIRFFYNALRHTLQARTKK